MTTECARKRRKSLREESYVFENRKHKWMALFDADDDVAEFLVDRNVNASFEILHAERARIERVTKLIENSGEKEIDEVLAIGRRLFFDRCGANGMYGNLPEYRSKHELRRKTSTSGVADDPDHPAKLVAELEKTAPGCIFMREHWQALRELLEPGKHWQAPDRLAAIRLLGRQPTEAATDWNVALIFVACDSLHAGKCTTFRDLLSDMDRDQVKRFMRNMTTRFTDLFQIVAIEEMRQLLIKLVEQNIARLEGLEAEFESRADEIAESTVAKLRCDESPETQRLSNYIWRARNGLQRGLASYEKYQKRQKRARDETPSRDQEYRGRTMRQPRASGDGMPEQVDLTWAYEASAGSDGEAPGLPGSEETGLREMARVDVLLETVLSGDEPESGDSGLAAGDVAETPTTTGLDLSLDLSGCDTPPVVEGDNAISVTNEPNSSEEVITRENHNCVDVTSNSGVISGLDKWVREGEGSADDGGHVAADRERRGRSVRARG